MFLRGIGGDRSELSFGRKGFSHMLTIVCSTKVSKSIYFGQMKHEVLIRFGQKVRRERLKLGLSQEDLASKAGVHRTYIGMIERAEKNITLGNINKIAKALDIPLNRLMEINNG